jgi:hypothetical protein
MREGSWKDQQGIGREGGGAVAELELESRAMASV